VVQSIVIVKEISLISPVAVSAIFSTATWTKSRSLKDIEIMMLNSGAIVLATHDDKPVGFARAITDYIYRAFIEDVIVIPEYKRHGIGSMMVTEIETILASYGINRIELDTANIDFWKKHGYKLKDSTEHMIKYRRIEC
jgi:GNAT superfamily N-acetyltransferase